MDKEPEPCPDGKMPETGFAGLEDDEGGYGFVERHYGGVSIVVHAASEADAIRVWNDLRTRTPAATVERERLSPIMQIIAEEMHKHCDWPEPKQILPLPGENWAELYDLTKHIAERITALRADHGELRAEVADDVFDELNSEGLLEDHALGAARDAITRALKGSKT